VTSKGRRGRNQNRVCDAPAAMTRQISNHFGSSQGLTEQDDILQLQCIHDSDDVVGKAIGLVLLDESHAPHVVIMDFGCVATDFKTRCCSDESSPGWVEQKLLGHHDSANCLL
jgi:hypothetical protein